MSDATVNLNSNQDISNPQLLLSRDGQFMNQLSDEYIVNNEESQLANQNNQQLYNTAHYGVEPIFVMPNDNLSSNNDITKNHVNQTNNNSRKAQSKKLLMSRISTKLIERRAKTRGNRIATPTY